MDDFYMDDMEIDPYVYRPATPFQDCVDKADAARGNPKALMACRDYVHDMHNEGCITGSEFLAVIRHIRWLLDCCRKEGGR